MRLWGRRRSGQYKPVPHRIHGMTSIDCTPAATAGLRQATMRDWMTPLELTVLGAIWGASFLFMRVAANDFGAVPLVEMRLGLGALVLLPFLWRSRAHFPRALWPKLALIGAIHSAVPFTRLVWAVGWGSGGELSCAGGWRRRTSAPCRWWRGASGAGRWCCCRSGGWRALISRGRCGRNWR